MNLPRNIPSIEKNLLTIIPSMEINGVFAAGDFRDLLPGLREHLFREKELNDDDFMDVVFVDDNTALNYRSRLPGGEEFHTAYRRFEASAIRSLRINTTHLELSRSFEHGEAAQSRSTAWSNAISWGGNSFPDGKSVLSLRCDVNSNESWNFLKSKRDALIGLLGEAFLWSTLGYRFRLDRSRIYSAGAEQASLGMRLLGVDWDDPFGAFSPLSVRGLRSIGWQTVVSPSAVKLWFEGKNKYDMPPSSHVDNSGNRFWQAGASPSIVDKHDGLTTDLSEYSRIGVGLSGICQHFNTEWFGSESFEPWSYRWDDFRH